jgi:hypothetical protein
MIFRLGLQKSPWRSSYFQRIDSCHTCTLSFDLWMSKGGVNTFVLIAQFLNDKWELCQVTWGFFEIVDTSRNVMVLQMNDLLAKHWHTSKMKEVIFSP